MNNAQQMSAKINGDIFVVDVNGQAYTDMVCKETLLTIDAFLDIFGHNNDMKMMLINYLGESDSLNRSGHCQASALVEISADKQSFEMKESREVIRISDICEKIERLRKPIAVAHRNLCSGDNLMIALSCNFRLSESGATYKFYNREVDELPLPDVVNRIVQMIGSHWAKLLIMANMTLDAREAQIAGLVHKVIPANSYDDELLNFCRHIILQDLEDGIDAKRQVLH